MESFRIENDTLGSLDISADALWGIHSKRAAENFPQSNRPMNKALIHAFGAVKLAAINLIREPEQKVFSNSEFNDLISPEHVGLKTESGK
ncbi:MAG: hypothetical protein Q7J65_08010 [Candidatus Marinimicrobia bacterium]|nr:hypothetical protein [Candidatus Neomarinimicrobiota bacterium]